jgi:hypothetical protein
MTYIDITKEVNKRDRSLTDLIDYLENVRRLYGDCSYRLYAKEVEDSWGSYRGQLLVYPKGKSNV